MSVNVVAMWKRRSVAAILSVCMVNVVAISEVSARVCHAAKASRSVAAILSVCKCCRDLGSVRFCRMPES